MTVLEAGIIAGAPIGAATGGLLCKPYGVWSGVGGAAAGLFVGGISGWLFAVILIGLLAVTGGLWRAARKQSDTPPTESDIRAMTPAAVAGTFVSALVGLALLMVLNWQSALLGLIVSAVLTAFVAVAKCELRRGE